MLYIQRIVIFIHGLRILSISMLGIVGMQKERRGKVTATNDRVLSLRLRWKRDLFGQWQTGRGRKCSAEVPRFRSLPLHPAHLMTVDMTPPGPGGYLGNLT